MKLPFKDPLARLAPRDRRAVLLGGLTVAAALVVYWGVLPWLGHWSDVRGQAQASQEELSRLQARGGDLLEARKRLVQAYGPGAGRPLEKVQAAGINLVKVVPETLRGAGLQIQNIQPQPARGLKEVPGVAALPIQVKATGTLAQLAQGLDALQASETLIVVEQVSAVGNEKKPGQLEVTLMLSSLARQGGGGT
jgi:hypothetical protein